MKNCHTKYPVILVHGINCNDDKFFYWGRCVTQLKKRGCAVFLGMTDSWGKTETNALQLKRRIFEILNESNCDKVNIIAHSKGGIDSRYMISALGMGKYVASLTTISTPHKGSKTALYWSKRKCILKIVAFFSNTIWKMLGDKYPDFENVIISLVPENMKKLNLKCIDDENVYYQSWGAVIDTSKEDFVMQLLRLFCIKHDGKTDGLVSPNSAVWGIYRGTIKNISHQDIIDKRKKKIRHFNGARFIVNIVDDLRRKGF